MLGREVRARRGSPFSSGLIITIINRAIIKGIATHPQRVLFFDFWAMLVLFLAKTSESSITNTQSVELIDF